MRRNAFQLARVAGPTHDMRIPRNRAVVMLVIDVSQSMRATDISPSRIAAAQDAAKQFTGELTPGINLGLVAYAGTASVLVSPTTNRDATKRGIDTLQVADRTATGEGIFTALQAIATVGAVIGGGDTPPPARIVLFSDGKETTPSNPDNPKGAYTAARTAKDQGVPISTISFGTPNGYVEMNGHRQPVPVDDATMKKVAQLSGGTAYNASSVAELKNVYATLQEQIGYESARGDASAGAVVGADVDHIASAVVVNALGERQVVARPDRGSCIHGRAESTGRRVRCS